MVNKYQQMNECVLLILKIRIDFKILGLYSLKYAIGQDFYFFLCFKMFMVGLYCVIGIQIFVKIYVVFKWYYKCKDEIYIIC